VKRGEGKGEGRRMKGASGGELAREGVDIAWPDL